MIFAAFNRAYARADGSVQLRGLLLALSSLLLACAGEPGATEPDVDASRAGPHTSDGSIIDAVQADARAQCEAGCGPQPSQPGADAALEAGAAPVEAGADASSEAGLAATPDAGAAEAGSASADCSGPGFCSGFEDQIGTSLSGAWKSVAPNCSGDGSAVIDTQVVHAGQRALRIKSGGGVCNHIFATPTLELAGFSASLWVRFFVRFDSAFKDDHVTFLAMHDEVSQKDLRMGGQKQIFMWNRERDDATLPELSPNGVSMSVAPKPGSWHCVEFQLQGEQGRLDTYVDGAPVPALVVDGTATHDIDGQWLNPGPFRARVTDLRLGWESYGSQPMTLWVDDVRVSQTRPGC